MYRLTSLILSIICLPFLFTCSEKSNPANNNHPQLHLDIQYTADPQLMVEAAIDSVGGNIYAQNARGVRFRLSIPPGAITEPTTIRMIPLASLTISGFSSPTCASCPDNDSLCCLNGVILEPEGLNFGNPAILTITFPDSMRVFTKGGVLVCLDSASNEYEICLSHCDSDSGYITGEIVHFSCFGSDDQRYDLLESQIYQQGELLNSLVGTTDFFYEVDYPSDKLWTATCPVPPYFEGYPDLKQSLETMVYHAWQNHISALMQNMADNCDGITNLRACYDGLGKIWMGFNGCEFSYRQEFENMREPIMDDIRSMFHRVADDGKEACDEGRCEEGREKLNCVHSAIRNMGLIEEESELYSNITGWLLNCCEFTGDLTIIIDHTGISPVLSFYDEIHAELVFDVMGDTIDGSGLGTHNVSVTVDPSCPLVSLNAPNFPLPMRGNVSNGAVDITFLGFNPLEYPVTFTLDCQGTPVEVPAYGPLESAIIYLHVRPHLLLQDGATCSGSGSEGFGEPYPIDYSYEITIHGGTR